MYRERLDQIVWRRRAFGVVILLEAIGWLGLLLFGLGLVDGWTKVSAYGPASWSIKTSPVWLFLVWLKSKEAVRFTIYSALWACGFSFAHLVLRSRWSEDL